MSERGFGMIEVLVTLIILAVGLLGLAGLQARAQRVELESYQRVQALILVEDMANRLRTNHRPLSTLDCYEITAAHDGESYIGTGNDPAACSGSGTAASRELADDDLADWNRLLEGGAETLGNDSVGAMTGARGCISYDSSTDRYTVSVAWQGEVPTTTPVSTCGENLYGNENLRRVVSRTVRIPDLD